MNKNNFIWIIGFVLLTNFSYADSINWNPAFTSTFNNSNWNITSGTVTTYADANTYFIPGTSRIISNSSTVKTLFSGRSSNESGYCIINISTLSAGIAGRGFGFANGSSGIAATSGTGGATSIYQVQSGSCASETGVCFQQSIGGGVSFNIFGTIQTDWAYYKYNMTYNNTNFTLYNIPYQAGQTYHQNGSLIIESGKFNMFENIYFGQPDDSPAFTGWNISQLTCSNVSNVSITVADTTPPKFTLINLTSEGGLGYIIYNDSNEQLGLMSGKARTNDSTPTFRANTNENSNCDIYDNRTTTLADCSPTGALVHTCTQTAILPIGLSNQTLNCSDTSGNRNQSEFLVNITDNIMPNSTIFNPANNLLFNTSVNSTINFTFFAIDNFDRNFTARLYIDNILNVTNTTYTNGTNASYRINVSSLGAHTWYVNFTDTFNNINQSEARSFTIVETNESLSIAFSFPTLSNNSITTNSSILINVSTTGNILKYTLEWNGTNETINSINATIGVLINKTGLADYSKYLYRVYVNDSNGFWNSTEIRVVNTNFIGVVVGVTVNVNMTFRGFLDRKEAFYGNQTLSWNGNNTAMTLAKPISKNITLYNNGTIVIGGSNNSNYTIDFDNFKITISNHTPIWNGTAGNTHKANILITDKLNISFNYYTGSVYLRTVNLSCSGQNESTGCLNISTALSSNNINISLIFNITDDPKRTRIIDDFTSSANWTPQLLRSNNTLNRTLANHSILCADMTSFNFTGRIRYRFNNSIELAYLNSTNQSNNYNFTFNCSSVNSVSRILNYSSKNISGFDFLNFSWRGDNTSNRFNLTLIDEAGTKVNSLALNLKNTEWNATGFSLGTLKNISIINISIGNISGTRDLSAFFIENIRLYNSTHNQSQYITMKAGCTSNYANSTVLIPNIMTGMCNIPNNTLTQFIWLWQDINSPYRGLKADLNYNITVR